LPPWFQDPIPLWGSLIFFFSRGLRFPAAEGDDGEFGFVQVAAVAVIAFVNILGDFTDLVSPSGTFRDPVKRGPGDSCDVDRRRRAPSDLLTAAKLGYFFFFVERGSKGRKARVRQGGFCFF